MAEPGVFRTMMSSVSSIFSFSTSSSAFTQHRFAHQNEQSQQLQQAHHDTINDLATTSSFWLENIVVIMLFFLATLFVGIILGIWYQKLSSIILSSSSSASHKRQNTHPTSTINSGSGSNNSKMIASSTTSNGVFATIYYLTSFFYPSVVRTMSSTSLNHTAQETASIEEANMKTEQDTNLYYSRIPNYTPPKHIAVIMDGNRRFGRKQHADPLQGHWAGGQTLTDFLQWSLAANIAIVTVYAFSTENWQRDPLEINALMSIFLKYTETILQEALAKNIQIRMLVTDQEKLPLHIQHAMHNIVAQTKHCQGMIFNICLSYGGRGEIVQACRKLVADAVVTHNSTTTSSSNNNQTNTTNNSEKDSINNHSTDSSSASDKTAHTCDPAMIAELVNERTLSEALLTGGLPDPEILIRTSGEFRLSNFLLWQLAYTECFFLDKFWPELKQEDFVQVLVQYHQRKRRFGT